MVSALEAALESPQLPPEARDRIQALPAAPPRRLERRSSEMRADVFVRRLIERVGLRRHRLFAATPETAERLVNLSRLAELAADWSRREPRGSVRDFIRQLSAIADAGDLDARRPRRRRRAQWWSPSRTRSRDSSSTTSTCSASRGRRSAATRRSATSRRPGRGRGWWRPGQTRARWSDDALARLRGDRGGGRRRGEIHEEELFGPAEGLHSTYRMVRDEVLEASWRAGSALSEMRLDTPDDVNAAVARYLELLKLAALIQRPGTEPAAEALAAINELIGRVATPEQRAALEASPLDEYVIGEERDRAARRELVASQREPWLEQFLPRRGDGLALSASDIDLYRTCPLKYKFARVFAIPQEPTINQRFGILIHQVLERFHGEELHRRRRGPWIAARGASIAC